MNDNLIKPDNFAEALQSIGVPKAESQTLQRRLLKGDILEGLAMPHCNGNGYQERLFFKLIGGLIYFSYKSDPGRTAQKHALSKEWLTTERTAYGSNCRVRYALLNILDTKGNTSAQKRYRKWWAEQKQRQTNTLAKIADIIKVDFSKYRNVEEFTAVVNKKFKKLKKVDRERVMALHDLYVRMLQTWRKSNITNYRIK